MRYGGSFPCGDMHTLQLRESLLLDTSRRRPHVQLRSRTRCARAKHGAHTRVACRESVRPRGSVSRYYIPAKLQNLQAPLLRTNQLFFLFLLDIRKQLRASLSVFLLERGKFFNGSFEKVSSGVFEEKLNFIFSGKKKKRDRERQLLVLKYFI